MIDKVVEVNIGTGELPAIVECTEGDTMWRWHFRLFFQGQRWTIPSGSRVWFTGKKADGNVFDFQETLQNNEVVADADVQITAAPGPCVAIVRVLDSASKTIATCPVLLKVRPNPQNEGPVSETVITGYEEVLAEMAVLIEAADRISGLTASATTLPPGSAATANVTGGTDGVPYNLALGIPKGEKGDTGPQGPRGFPGQGAVSTVMEVEPTSEGDVLAKYLFNKIYPVGSIYMSTDPTSPATRFGGSWEQIQNCFLLAAGSSYAAGSSGGVASQDIDVAGQANIGVYTYKASPNANLNFYIQQDDTPVGGTPGTDHLTYSEYTRFIRLNNPAAGSSPWGTYTDEPDTFEGSPATQVTASAENVNNMPPYLAVYVWKRTALAT